MNFESQFCADSINLFVIKYVNSHVSVGQVLHTNIPFLTEKLNLDILVHSVRRNLKKLSTTLDQILILCKNAISTQISIATIHRFPEYLAPNTQKRFGIDPFTPLIELQASWDIFHLAFLTND